MSFNFKDVELPKGEVSYVKPGFWTLAPVKAELVETSGKTPYLNITFEGNSGKLVDKFYLSEKALPRLLYLHTELYNKALEKDFATSKEVETYFNTLFEKKVIPLNLKVIGQEAVNGKIYASLPYTSFVSSDNDFEEFEIVKESPLYTDFVKKNTSPTSNSPIIQDGYKPVIKDDEAMPWDN